MQAKSDAQLLRDYAENGNEAAFRELVVRHTNLVYSAGLRQMASPDLARDVAQSVFTDLARKAQSLARTFDESASLLGWLYRSTRFAALTLLREERRRQARERQAMENFDLAPESAPEWDRVRPVLDEAMADLSDEDRDAVLQRFFKNRDFRSVGVALGVTDDAAQKRVSRALEKLRAYLAHRGVTTTAAALSTVLSANAVQIAPVGLAASLTSASLAGAAGGTGTTITLIKFMAMTKLKAGIIGAVVVAGVATPLVIRHQSKLREENESMQQQIAQLQTDNESLSNRVGKIAPTPRLPAPRMQATAAPAEIAAQDLPQTNLMYWLFQGKKAPKPTAEQVASYLKENGRTAGSLLAAFRVTGDETLLAEALEKYPDDPQVNFAAVFKNFGPAADPKKEVSPEERRQRLDAFKQSAPDNALANYLSALDYFKSGQTDQAVQELNAAAGKQPFQDYSIDFVQNGDEAYRAAGYSEAEAKALASSQLILPHLAQMRDLSQNLIALANSYRQAGDEASAQAALQMSVNLGQRLEGSAGETMIGQLVGVAIERNALSALDPNSPYGSAGQTVKDRLDQLSQQRAAIKELARQVEAVVQTMSARDWVSYNDRQRVYGEEAAARWLISKHGQK